LTRGLVCSLQRSHSLVRVAQGPQLRTAVSFESPPTWKAKSLIFIPQEQGGRVISLGTGLPFCCLLRFAGLRWRYSNSPPNTLFLCFVKKPWVGPNIKYLCCCIQFEFVHCRETCCLLSHYAVTAVVQLLVFLSLPNPGQHDTIY
jgi:hypothetical protein